MIKRNTVQRTLVLETVQRLRSHPTADEIYAEISKICPSISRATVYRNLQQLCEQGVITRREIPGSPDRYDHVTTNHYHARCLICGKVIDVDMDYLSELPAAVKDAHGFKLTGHSVVFDGVCAECQKEHRCPVF